MSSKTFVTRIEYSDLKKTILKNPSVSAVMHCTTPLYHLHLPLLNYPEKPMVLMAY